MSALELGIDTGGTFTDFVIWDGATLRTRKRLSTPDDPSRTILETIAAVAPAPAAVIHGTTVATNALLERRGARTGLLTTDGFADLIEIGRQSRPHLYRLLQPPAPALVPPERRWTVNERVASDGRVLGALDERALDRIGEQIEDAGVESLAIVFLFSFLDPSHERRCEEILAARLPALAITRSSALLPEYREYERTATTVINAYLRPPVERYLSRLEEGVGAALGVMQSNGGVIPAAEAAREAARLALSGPAGGVVGAFELMRRLTPEPRILTLDMGGTSSDVALCPGAIPTSPEAEIAGLPLRLPVVDIQTVGAGGGSIAWIDPGGALRVGPESAGADPGPACYGRGGSRPTVTDANLLLGRLDPAGLLGGRLALDVAAARRAFEPLAAALERPIEAAALGVIEVANATMGRALRRVSIERGYDPRDFTLVPFGGAGPLHACALAESLSIPRIVVPPLASVLSALGMLLAPEIREGSRALLQPLEPSLGPALARAVESLRARLGAEEGARWEATLDCRYVGQGYEIPIPLDLPLPPEPATRLTGDFHAAHERRYGTHLDRPVESVTLRVRRVQPPRLDAARLVPVPPSGTTSPESSREIWFEPSGPTGAAVRSRHTLAPGAQVAAPALITQPDTATLVAPGWVAHVDEDYNLVLVPEAT